MEKLKGNRLKAVVGTAFIVVLLFGMLIGTIYSVNVGDVTEVWIRPPIHDAQYIVGVYNSTYFYMKNGTTGNYDYRGTNATTTINFALANLTTGRLWKEKVLIIGNLSNLEQIQIPSYAILKLQGILKVKDAFNNDFIINSALSNPDTEIEIEGGIIDGNRAGQTSGMDTILFTNVINSTIHDTEVRGGKRITSGVRGETICLQSCTGVVVRHVTAMDSSYDLIKTRDSTLCRIENCFLYNRSLDFIGGNHVQLDGTTSGTNLSIVSGCTMYSPTGSSNGGVAICHAGSFGNLITGNIVYGGNCGYRINGVSGGCMDNEISNNVAYSCYYGITLEGGASTGDGQFRTLIANNKLINCTYGIYCDHSYNTTIIENMISGGTSAGIRLYSSDCINTTIMGNTILDKSTIITNAGTSTIIKYNIGYTTENSGVSANATATTFSITHGLAGTPTGVWCSFNTTAVTAWTWTATASTITVTMVGPTNNVTCYWNAVYVP